MCLYQVRMHVHMHTRTCMHVHTRMPMRACACLRLHQDPPQHVHWLHRSLRYAKRNLSLRCYRPPTLHGHVPPLTCTLCNYGRQV